jgi:hypothetical protein
MTSHCNRCGGADRVGKYRVQVTAWQQECVYVCHECKPYMTEIILELRELLRKPDA